MTENSCDKRDQRASMVSMNKSWWVKNYPHGKPFIEIGSNKLNCLEYVESNGKISRKTQTLLKNLLKHQLVYITNHNNCSMQTTH